MSRGRVCIESIVNNLYTHYKDQISQHFIFSYTAKILNYNQRYFTTTSFFFLLFFFSFHFQIHQLLLFNFHCISLTINNFKRQFIHFRTDIINFFVKFQQRYNSFTIVISKIQYAIHLINHTFHL